MKIARANNKKLKTVCVALLLVSLIITAFAGCNSENTESSGNAESVTASKTESVPVQESSQTESDVSVFDNQSGDESQNEESEDSVIENESSEDESSEPETSEPEILGSGTKDDPYLAIPDGETMTFETLEIAAGKLVYYDIYRVGGMIMNINSSSAYVVYNGDRYDAENGIVSVKIAAALASDAISFEIGNSGNSPEVFSISFINVTGSFDNPDVIKTLGGENKISLEEGSDTGHYYKYIAEKDGVIRFYITATVDSVMLVTNNRNSAQRTSEDDVLTDDQGNDYFEIEVIAGDELIINVGAKPKRGKYPATEITWSGKYN